MSDPNLHAGGCHCGAVRYEVNIDLGQPVVACYCSICQKTGTLLGFVPAAQFKLLSGGDTLTDYLFNKRVIHHLFCPVCGVRSFARGELPSGPMIAVNVRCLDDVDLDKLTLRHYDGKHL